MGSFIDGSKCCSPDPSTSSPVVHRLRHIADPCIAHDNIPVAGRSLSVAHSGESRVPKELRVHCFQREVGVAINVEASTCQGSRFISFCLHSINSSQFPAEIAEDHSRVGIDLEAPIPLLISKPRGTGQWFIPLLAVSSPSWLVPGPYLSFDSRRALRDTP